MPVAFLILSGFLESLPPSFLPEKHKSLSTYSRITTFFFLVNQLNLENTDNGKKMLEESNLNQRLIPAH